jgi:hypothetical protein
MMTYTDNMNEIIKSFTEYKQTVQETLKKEFKAIITKLFEENSELKAIVWEQFTPYFSDGDPCIFSVNEVAFTNATGDDLDDIRYGEYDGENEDVRVLSSYFTPNSQWSRKEDNEYAKLIDFKTFKAFGQLMTSSEMKDVMLATFGDHVRVVVTREGFSIDEFDHE